MTKIVFGLRVEVLVVVGHTRTQKHYCFRAQVLMEQLGLQSFIVLRRQFASVQDRLLDMFFLMTSRACLKRGYGKYSKNSNTKTSDKMTYANNVDPDQTAGAV